MGKERVVGMLCSARWAFVCGSEGVGFEVVVVEEGLLLFSDLTVGGSCMWSPAMISFSTPPAGVFAPWSIAPQHCASRA